jgi:hypothetical protein
MHTELVSDRFQNARKHLDVYEENWQRDHQEAMEFWAFQAFLAEGVRVYELIRDTSRLVRRAVYRGFIPPLVPEVAVVEREMFEQWLKTAGWCSPHVGRFEKEYGSVEGAGVFRAYVSEGKAFVADWRPQQVAKAGGSRVWAVTQQEAAKMKALLDAAAPLKVTPRSLPEGDPTELK